MSKLELIIVDNGSTDTQVTDYIKALSPPCAKYSFILNERNDYPSCLRFAKIQARKEAAGKFFIDCPDDHIFVVQSDWIGDSIANLHQDNTIGCVIHFAQPQYRYAKLNNKMMLQPTGLFRSIYKGYADYHVMKRAVYERLGEYEYKLGRKAEGEYMDRALSCGYYRNIMRLPVALINDDGYSFSKSISMEDLARVFEKQEHPVTNEQLISLAVQMNLISMENDDKPSDHLSR